MREYRDCHGVSYYSSLFYFLMLVGQSIPNKEKIVKNYYYFYYNYYYKKPKEFSQKFPKNNTQKSLFPFSGMNTIHTNKPDK